MLTAPDLLAPEAWATPLLDKEPVAAAMAHAGAERSIHLHAPAVERRGTDRRTRTRTWIRRADVAIVVLALCALHVATAFQTRPPTLAALSTVSLRLSHALVLFTCAYIWVKLYEAFGLYAARERISLRAEMNLVMVSSLLAVLVTVLVHIPLADAVAYHGPHVLSNMMILWTTVVIVTAGVHGTTRRISDASAQRVVRHVLIVGSGPRAVQHYHTLMQDTRRRHHVAGFVDVVRHPALSSINAPLLGRLHELESILARTVVDEVYVALPLRSCYNEFQRTIHLCERLGVRAVYSMDAFEYRIAPPKYDQVAGMPVAMLTPVVRDGHLPFKRAIDIILSGLALVILSPVFGVIALLVVLTNPGPIIFSQERFGQNKRQFRLHKFRSMRVDAEEVLQRDPVLWNEYRQNHFKLPESRDPRVTPIGRFLRKTSLDELPQLWNVFRGDMSVIGPRPIVPAEIEHYGPFATLLLALKPGLTGAWVVNGRSTVGYPRRAEIELSYVRQWSLWHDLRIFLRTIPAVLVGKGAH